MSPVSVMMQSTSSSSQVWSGGPVGLSFVVVSISVVDSDVTVVLIASIVDNSSVLSASETSVTMGWVGIAVVMKPKKCFEY